MGANARAFRRRGRPCGRPAGAARRGPQVWRTGRVSPFSLHTNSLPPTPTPSQWPCRPSPPAPLWPAAPRRAPPRAPPAAPCACAPRPPRPPRPPRAPRLWRALSPTWRPPPRLPRLPPPSLPASTLAVSVGWVYGNAARSGGLCGPRAVWGGRRRRFSTRRRRLLPVGLPVLPWASTMWPSIHPRIRPHRSLTLCCPPFLPLCRRDGLLRLRP